MGVIAAGLREDGDASRAAVLAPRAKRGPAAANKAPDPRIFSAWRRVREEAALVESKFSGDMATGEEYWF